MLDKSYSELKFLNETAVKVMQEFADELGCTPDNEAILQAIDDLKNKVAELERQRGALVVELSSLKSFSDRLVDMHNGLNGSGGGIYDEGSITYQQAALTAAMDAFDEIKTPIADAALREIGAKAVEKLANHMLTNGYEHEACGAEAYAQQLREGKI